MTAGRIVSSGWLGTWLVVAAVRLWTGDAPPDAVELAIPLALAVGALAVGLTWRSWNGVLLSCAGAVGYALLVGSSPCPPRPYECQTSLAALLVFLAGVPVAAALSLAGWGSVKSWRGRTRR
jgi:hypothetical protein